MAQIFKLELESKSKLVNIGGAWKGTTNAGQNKIEITIKDKITLYPGERIQLLENKDGGKPALDKEGKEKVNNGGYPIVKPHYNACIGGYNSKVELVKDTTSANEKVSEIVNEKVGE
jgi:hypothetical protein